MMLSIEQDLTAYARWADGIWDPGVDGLAERDLTIMSLGLGGETGEVLLVLEQLPQIPVNRTTLCKELGDVWYYWSQLANAFKLCPRAALATVRPDGPALPGDFDAMARELTGPDVPQDDVSRLRFALSLSARAGAVQEVLKKRVRDGVFNEQLFAIAMGQMGQAWCRLVLSSDLLPSQVLRANITKVEDRHARGVMKGSGDDR